jgi:hypothetical protein
MVFRSRAVCPVPLSGHIYPGVRGVAGLAFGVSLGAGIGAG